jgi:hypothetical protein
MKKSFGKSKLLSRLRQDTDLLLFPDESFEAGAALPIFNG